MMIIGLLSVVLWGVVATGYDSMTHKTFAILSHSVVGNSESLAIYLSLLLPVGLAYRKKTRSKKWGHLASFACIGGFLLLLATGSRSALMALLIVGIIYVVVNWKNRSGAMRRPFVIVGFLVLALLAVATIVNKSFLPTFASSFQNVEQAMSNAFSSRTEVWSSGLTYILTNPFFGHGHVENVYNLYLQIGSFFGLPALVAFLALLFISFKGMGEETALQTGDQNLTNGLYWGMMALLFTSLGESTWGNSLAYMNWFVLFLIGFRNRELETSLEGLGRV
jgi:O-antigen ligase